MRCYLLFCLSQCLLVLTLCTVFWFNESDILKWCDTAETSLKIYIYPNPTAAAASSSTSSQQQTKCSRQREYFQLEQLLPEYIMKSTIYTTDPQVADLYFITHDLVCTGLSQFSHVTYQTRVLDPIWNQFLSSPYYRRSNGSNHVFIFMCDNGVFCDAPGGACHLPSKYTQYLEHMIIIGNYGYSNKATLRHTHSQLSYNHNICFRENHDIVVPQLHKFTPYNNNINSINLYKYNKQIIKNILFYFSGNIIHGVECSPGVRPILKSLKLQYNYQDANISYQLPNKYLYEYNTIVRKHHLKSHTSLKQAIFGFCPAGHACWSTRLYDAIFSMTIPIIIATGIIEPFERVFNWRTFTMKLESSHLTANFLKRVMTYVRWDPSTKSWSYHPQCARLMSQTIQNLRSVSPWLTWRTNPPYARNAWRLIVLELFCRTEKGKSALSSLCASPSSHIAMKTYLLGGEDVNTALA
jgi:Exostosin family